MLLKAVLAVSALAAIVIILGPLGMQNNTSIVKLSEQSVE